MNHRVIAGMLLILSLVAIAVGYLLLNPWLIGLCSTNSYCLDSSLIPALGTPLFWGMQWLPLLFFILIFIRREVFSAWWKVILPLSIPAIWIIIISPPFPDFLVTDRTTITALMVKLIMIISTIVVAWKYWRLYRAKACKKGKTA
jgi:hypothetical protein